MGFDSTLRYFAANDTAYQACLNAQLSFDAAAHEPSGSGSLAYGNIVVLDQIHGHHEVVYRARTSIAGYPIEKSSRDLLQDLKQLPGPEIGTTRILLHNYVYGEDEHCQGLNHLLVSEFADSFGVDTEMYGIHFEDKSKVYVQTLPSNRPVLYLSSDETVCTAQVCPWPWGYQSNGLECLVILHGEYFPVYVDSDELEVNDVHQNYVDGISKNVMLGLFGHLGSIDPSRRIWNLKTWAGLYLHVLQNTAFSSKAVADNVFELMTPMMRITLSEHFGTLTDHTNVISDLMKQYQRKAEVSEDELETARHEAQDSLMDLGFQNRDLHMLLEDIRCLFPTSVSGTQNPIVTDAIYVVARFDAQLQSLQMQYSMLNTLDSLEETRASQTQNKTVKRLTQLAMIFVPSSLVFSAFGMNIDVLQGNGVEWWTVVVGAMILYAVLAILMVMVYLESHKDKKKELRQVKERLRKKLRLKKPTSSIDERSDNPSRLSEDQTSLRSRRFRLRDRQGTNLSKAV